MKTILSLITISLMASSTCAQNVIPIPHKTNKNIKWSNGTSVIIAPGGGLYALSIESEGTAVAKWLNEQGITAFVLKYRLVPTGEDGVQEITEEGNTDPKRIGERVAPVLPLSIADGLSAISYVRSNASALKLNPNKIGFMGFSAGGAVTMGVTYNYSKANRPDFIVPIYPWTTVLPVQAAPENAPPMLVICATDDPLGLASGSVELYTSWLKAQKSVGLHMYTKGGHGFGMKEQGLPFSSSFFDLSTHFNEKFFNAFPFNNYHFARTRKHTFC